MENIKIYSPFDCLIVGRDCSEFLSKNEHIEINASEKLFVYPIGKPQNFAFILDPNVNSPFYKSITTSGEKLFFLLGGEGGILNTYSLVSLSFHGKVFEIKVGRDKLILSYDKTEQELLLPFEIVDFTHGREEHIAYILCHGESCDFLTAFNLENKKIKTFWGDKITISSHKILLENKGNISEYLLDSDGLSLLSSKSVQSNFFAPNFFTYLKEDNYSSAYSLLSPALQEKLSIKDFKHFFGKISYFFPLSPTKVFALSNGLAKLYTLSIENNLLADIDDGE